MSSEMIEKFDKYLKEIQGPMGLATILDPWFKIDYLLGFIETLTGQSREECAQKLVEVKNILYDLMKEYEVEEDDNTESLAPPLANSGACLGLKT
ncbi:hypothetical protein E2562_028791 [Oryza meyeriana var. granulata]|uniref:hAT-like transposase RNase-H fold domain-containing protein n=1 Tax=Oryza meyeriana var. granulata TaxID=110450 RepID=A0A6G1EBN5_9ORYZ|nr:hypothetical protein E2562_028791 [Oryza meyeriana var. granulata]